MTAPGSLGSGLDAPTVREAWLREALERVADWLDENYPGTDVQRETRAAVEGHEAFLATARSEPLAPAAEGLRTIADRLVDAILKWQSGHVVEGIAHEYRRAALARAPATPEAERPEDLIYETKPDRGFVCRASKLDEPGEALVEILHEGTVIRSFKYPAYRVYNIAAHFSEIVDSEIANDDRGYRIADWNGIGPVFAATPPNDNPTPPDGREGEGGR